MFRILSLAGGGLRGAFAIGLLGELEKRLEHPLAHYFDLIAGTSTGSITAASLCCGMKAQDVEDFYAKFSEKIFHPRDPYSPKGLWGAVYPALRWAGSTLLGRNLDHFFQSRYCPFSLTAAMEDAFGNRPMRGVEHSRLLIPTVNLTDGITAILRTPHLPRHDPAYDWRVADVIVASAAAPTYFPHKRMPDGKDYADGGLWAIDPGVAALAESVRIMEDCSREEDCRFQLDEVWMLSIGTGQSDYSLSPPDADAGMLYWGQHVADVMSISQVQGTQLPLRIVLDQRYRQVDFELEDPSWTLDNLRITGELFDRGREEGARLFDELRETFLSTPTGRYTAYSAAG
ncbi:MAG: patatin-like phospholipase family protein [Planctomycetota bacterium]